MSVNSKMTAIADPIRSLMGLNSQMSLDAMAKNLVEASTSVNSQAELIQQISSALEGKAASDGGVSIPDFRTATMWESGKITIAEESYKFEIPHNLGSAPQVAIVFRESPETFTHDYEYRWSLSFKVTQNDYSTYTSRNAGSRVSSTNPYINVHYGTLSNQNGTTAFTTRLYENRVVIGMLEASDYFKVCPGATYWWIFGV